VRKVHAAAPSRDELGSALRNVRNARGLSLAQVALATGISRSLLSLIETGRSDITLSRLVILSHFYGLPIAELLAPPPRDSTVVRKDERRRLSLATEGIEIEYLTAEAASFLPFVASLDPGASPSEQVAHPGEEFVHVLEGAIRIDRAGSEPLTLEAGDSALYSSDRPHRWVNVGGAPARLLAVASPPPTPNGGGAGERLR
jgi:transcriptional regulator with XRE-family HTH domain